MSDPSSSHGQLGRKTTTGILWSGFGLLGNNLLSFVTMIVLARLLAPEEFGILGMILVLTGFANLLTDVGFGAALIQRKEVSDEALTSVLWTNLLISTLMWGLFVLGAPLVAWFYDEPILEPITMVYSVIFVISGFRVVQQTIYEKRLDFRPLVLINVLAVVIGGVVAILMAWQGAGVWSLVAHSLVVSAVGTAGLWVISPWRPTGFIHRQVLAELWEYSSHLIKFRVINYWLRQGDDLLVARFVGASALGLYSRAYFFLLMPLKLFSRAVSTVLFPALSSIQDDLERVRQFYRMSVRGVSLVSFPTMIGLAVVADSFVLVVLGEQWEEMIPILRLFAVVGLFQSVGTLNGNIYQSLGRTRLQFRVGAVVGAFWLAAICTGLQWGLMGVVYAYSAYSVLAFYPTIHYAVSLIGLNVWDVIKDASGSLSCSVIMGIAVAALHQVLPSQWPGGLNLLLEVIFGVAFYGLVVHLLSIRGYVEIRAALEEHLGRS